MHSSRSYVYFFLNNTFDKCFSALDNRHCLWKLSSHFSSQKVLQFMKHFSKRIKHVLTRVTVYAFVSRVTRADEGGGVVRARSMFTGVVTAFYLI